jgi:hypothetical protein
MRTFPGGRGGDEVEKVCGRRCCHQARKIDDNRALSLLMWEMCERELDSYYIVATRKTKVSSGLGQVPRHTRARRLFARHVSLSINALPYNKVPPSPCRLLICDTL